MTQDFLQAATIVLSEQDASRIGAAAVRVPVTGEDPFADPVSRAAARETVAEGWPGFEAFVARVAEQVRTPPYFALVRDVPPRAPVVFLVALASSLGKPMDPFQQSWSRLVYQILPRNDVQVDGEGVLNEHLHTDGTDWPEPNSLTCLLCERPDQNGGGRSRLLPLHLLLEHLRRENGPLLDLLSGTPVPWLIMDSLGGGVRWSPILADDRIQWLKVTIDRAVASGAELDERVAAVLDRFEQLVDRCPSAAEFALAAGDLLLVNNTRCLHARTPVRDPARSERALSRIKIML